MSTNNPLPKLTDLRPRLTVIGVGGAGCNAVNNMIAAGLTGADFIVANTDAQALAASSSEHRVQLGTTLTEGLGAGSKPEVGEAAAEEAIDELRAQIAGSHMVFIAAGMGGGTGTGAASVVARVARDLGILTVGIVTKPFLFEGTRRARIAEIGVAELKKYVDTLIVIPNQNLFRVANERTTFAEAFVLADQVLYSGVACIVDLIVKEGLINLDFADVRTVMSGMGTAMMGTGEASGERRAILAAEEAIANPLLDDVSLKGARGLLLSISGGRNLTLYEVDEAATRVREEVDPEANIIVGATFDESLGDRIRVSIVASGMMRQEAQVRHDMDRAAPMAPPMPAVPAPLRAEAPRGLDPQQPMRARPGADQETEVDIHRRLSNALQGEAHDRIATTDWSAHARPPGPLPAPPSQLAPARTATAGAKGPEDHRGPWQSPGHVLIEETPALPQVRRSDPPRQPAAAAPAAFTPEMPADVRRSQRRMPEVDEFPVVAQREYRAKGGGGAVQPAEREAKRPGLLERFTALGWRQGDSHSNTTPQPQTGQLRVKPAQPQRAPRGPAGPGWTAADDTGGNAQDVDLQKPYARDRS